MAGRFDRPGVALIVDDNPDVCRTLKKDFERHDCDVLVATSRQRALEEARRRTPMVAVVDMLLGDESGLDVIDDLAHAAPSTRCAHHRTRLSRNRG